MVEGGQQEPRVGFRCLGLRCSLRFPALWSLCAGNPGPAMVGRA